MNGTVCVLGSFNVDIVARVPRFPQGNDRMGKRSDLLSENLNQSKAYNAGKVMGTESA
jgi:hypothetical protein